MRCCLDFAKDYGAAIILFTLLTKIVLFPLNVWLHKNSIKMIRMQPELNLINARNIGNTQKVFEEQKLLYKREKYKPLGGIIPMAIQIPIIIGLISVVRQPMQYLLRLDSTEIQLLTECAAKIMRSVDMSKISELNVVSMIQNPIYTATFQTYANGLLIGAVNSVCALDVQFGSMLLTSTPQLLQTAQWHSGENFMPFIACASAFLLSYAQNKINILQIEANWFSRWGMAIFLSLFSLYFGCVVPTSVSLYWVASNLFAILVMFAVYWAIPPHKYIDYAELDESKAILDRSKKVAIQFHDTPEHKKKAQKDYYRFCHPEEAMQLIFYSERGGYYKYFAAIIERVIANSDIVVHYITSDPNDSVLSRQNAQFKSYYLDEHLLILAFMKADADIMVMTMPDLQQYHLKRSYFRKDMEYVYIYHAMIVGSQTVRKGATEYYDTLFCTGDAHVQQEKKLEEFYHWNSRNIIACGYPLLDQLIDDYSKLDKTVDNKPRRILIAPSYQDDNILDSCLSILLKILYPAGYDITVRPHPQYIKMYPAKIAQLYEDCLHFDGDRFRIQSDFGSNDTVYTSDLIITDWSSIAYEFSFTTLKPVLFVNTPRKIINQDYLECEIENPPEIYLRHVIGKSIAPENIENELLSIVEELLAHAENYETLIAEARSRNISNIGQAANIASNYIISKINGKG